MDSFRNLILQRTLSLIILLTALLSQTQMLYACELMEGEPKRVCCCGEHAPAACPMEDACTMQEKADQNRCCEVSYEPLADEVMMNSPSTVDCLTLLLDGPQPPPDIEFQQLLAPSLQMISRLTLSSDEPLILSSGKQKYLLTRRLRL